MDDLIALAETGSPEAALLAAERFADSPDAEVQTTLARALYKVGRRDPEALSVFLAANAFRLPRATVLKAGKALPEAG